ncbi:MAG: M23 family metallopeptidase [Gracilimonas sp.]|uniref:M23 family metallopeptidase n=1 Tax=Gracilimonas sediminicola TaxID=2952158 RepID=A0A9X2L581_9BACT|nr:MULTISPECIES: M23 family metallopeptidase [Gracilimonas]MBO6586201.1 M23 family metallopeptidase [Gracilimonas sp.]MBO6614858.1 M23 family metallopeptidase [Gracilimonas sp.]MCP9292524.1 M23 family metallopeptidase [Gracilimonas sediminicola]
MSIKNHYYYDETNCEFVPIEYNRLEQVVYNLSIWILSGVVLTGIGIILLSTYIGTPAELALKAENEALYEQLESTKDALVDLDEQITAIAEKDNEMYRSVLGMDQISYEERQAGVGGSDPYNEFDVYNESTSELLKWTASKVDNLERRIGIQKLSFEEIKSQYNVNKEKMSHIPAIKPTSGILLSGYGVRYHPILKYNRRHNGLDFRADIGDPVFTTGNGKIRFAGRKGTLGLVVIVDHGFGFETLYAHLSGLAKGIKNGSEVERGEQIGMAGDSGLSEGPHLHYEVHFKGEPVDPIYYLFADTSPEEYAMFKEISETNKNSLD